MSVGPPLISFVIPVKNDAVRLARCLATIAANSYPSERVEIVVADNGSVDRSPEIAREAGAHVLPLPGLPVAELRNRAVAATTGSVIAFVDADHEISRDWIASAAAAFDNPKVGAVGALCRAPDDGTWVQTLYGVLRGRTRGRQDVTWLGAGNMAVRREAFSAVGGFDRSLETCEDVDLCQRLVAGGWRVIGDEALDNVHLGDPPTLARLFRGERWRGRDNLRVSLRGRLTVRDLPSIIIPIAEATALVVIPLALLAALVAGSWPLWLASAAAAGVVACTALRWARMVTAGQLRSPLVLIQAGAVAFTYDMARATALLTRSGHHSVGRNGAR